MKRPVLFGSVAFAVFGASYACTTIPEPLAAREQDASLDASAPDATSDERGCVALQSVTESQKPEVFVLDELPKEGAAARFIRGGSIGTRLPDGGFFEQVVLVVGDVSGGIGKVLDLSMPPSSDLRTCSVCVFGAPSCGGDLCPGVLYRPTAGRARVVAAPLDGGAIWVELSGLQLSQGTIADGLGVTAIDDPPCFEVPSFVVHAVPRALPLGSNCSGNNLRSLLCRIRGAR
jgi:hypothetical protein